jgi:histidinol-phosphate aminotransferase
MPCDFNSLPHEGIQTIAPYIPGKSTQEVAREQGIEHIIKLASNENPLGCSPRVTQALCNLSAHEIATYPLATGHPLRHALAEHLGVERDMLTFGNGTDCLFPLFINCFALHRNKHVIIPEYSFIAYGIHAKSLGIPVVTTPLNSDWTVDVDAIINCTNQNTALIFLANPNNPTGSVIGYEKIERILANIPETTILVLDEAYYEYLDIAHQSTGMKPLGNYKNLIITRTFSKAYGLAGLRLGYAIADAVMTEIFHKVLPPFTVNQTALVAAYAALEDQAFINESVRNNERGLQQVKEGLDSLSLFYLPSSGNFITVDFKHDALKLYQDLQRLGIIVRPLHPYHMANFLRVTIGTPEQNQEFLDKLALCL